MKNKKVIVFDLDGVLLDSVDLMLSLNRGAFPGITDKQTRDFYRGNIYEESSKSNLPKVDETEEEKQKRWDAYNKIKLNVSLHKGIKELLSKLSKKYILTINTSSWDVTTLPILELNDVKKQFSFIATSNITMNKIEKFKTIAHKFKMKPMELLFITDTLGDVKEAGLLSIPTIVVTWGMHGRKYFDEKAYKNIVGFVNTVEELENYIVSSFK